MEWKQRVKRTNKSKQVQIRTRSINKKKESNKSEQAIAKRIINKSNENNQQQRE